MKLFQIFGKYVLFKNDKRVYSTKCNQKALTMWACNSNLIDVKTAIKNGLIK